MKLRKLAPPDSLHLEAAEGWLGLGNYVEADAELDCITPVLRVHPEVLSLRWQIYEKARKWEACLTIAETLVAVVPRRASSWTYQSFALHELGRTQEAFDKLLPVIERFPKVWTIPYYLSCYCAQLYRIDESMDWFKKAMTIDIRQVQLAAIDNPDLKPLWDRMSGTMWKREE